MAGFKIARVLGLAILVLWTIEMIGAAHSPQTTLSVTDTVAVTSPESVTFSVCTERNGGFRR